MKFEHNNVDRCHDENFRNRILKILPQRPGWCFQKTQKIVNGIAAIETAQVLAADTLEIDMLMANSLVFNFTVHLCV